MWKRRCEEKDCGGTMVLKEVISAVEGKSKGNFWRCEKCGADAPEHEVELGDRFIDLGQSDEEYKLVWISGNPTVYTDHFSSYEEMMSFIHNTLVRDKEYPITAIRKSDFKAFPVKDVPVEQRNAGNLFYVDFNDGSKPSLA